MRTAIYDFIANMIVWCEKVPPRDETLSTFSLGCYWRGHRHARATTTAAPRHCSVNTKSCSGATLP